MTSTAGRILCIEDEADLRDDLVQELQEAGHDVVEAGNGLDALEIILNGGISLVLSDMQLPRLSGLDLIREVHAQRGVEASPPFVFLTAYGDPQMREDMEQAGARHLLVKPIDYDELLDLVAVLLPTDRPAQ